jgi:drug/metabolite transporter (DMT)-like permease
MGDGQSDRSEVSKGILMVMTAVVFFSVIDFLAKYLTRYYPIALIVWARFTFHLLFVIVALGPRYGLALVRTKRLGMQITRGLLLACGSLLFVTALKFMPLAETTAILYLAPLLVTLFSVVFLKESVELARWIAVLFGFVGVLTIIRPGSNVFSWAVLLPITNAVSFASYQILTRRLAGLESPYASIFYVGLVGSLLSSLALPSFWQTPQNALHATAFVAIGALGGLAHLIFIKAYDHAPASRLAPFSYSQLIWVTAIGFFVFGDFPDAWSLVGIGILVASGIYIASHQRRVERRNGD